MREKIPPDFTSGSSMRKKEMGKKIVHAGAIIDN